MKRTLVATAWVAGWTIPLLVSAVFIFGCCVLPFHHLIHRVMPLCQIAAQIVSGGHHHGDAGQVPMPAREKQEPAKRICTAVPVAYALDRAVSETRVVTLTAASYRNFLSLGAMRCDQDVGLHVVIETFLI